LLFVVTVGLVLIGSHPALASVSTKQVSVTRGGGDPRGASAAPSISADGRYVAFSSKAGNLVQGDYTMHWSDIFVRDLVAGTTVRASLDTGGGDPNGGSYEPTLSADGRYVAFHSFASDLAAGDGNAASDVFVRDLIAGTTVRASVDSGGGDPNSASFSPSISADGRYVAFHSFASDLVAGDGNADYDIFVRDLVARTTVRASLDTGGGDPNGGSLYPAISADGRYVAFHSYASDLVPRDGNGLLDVFVRDLGAATTVRASVDTAGGDPNADSFFYGHGLSISADGRYVTFSSYAGDLVPGRGDRGVDVFVARWSSSNAAAYE
jgi:Tol biopolymer transport system component